MTTCYVIMKSCCDDYYDERYDAPVIVFTDRTIAEKYVEDNDILRERFSEWQSFLSDRGKNIKDLRVSLTKKHSIPTYEEKVKAIGPKPVFDHTKQHSREYNQQHHIRMQCWNNLFVAWADYDQEWNDKVSALVEAEIKEIIEREHLKISDDGELSSQISEDDFFDLSIHEVEIQ